MKILISLIAAYIISGLAHVGKQIFARPIDMTSYGRKPTMGLSLFIIFGWPFLPIMMPMPPKSRGRNIYYTFLGAAFQIGILGFIIWCVLSVSEYLFNLVF